jgi:hypothetical protein
MLNSIQQAAYDHAKQIEWEPAIALEYAYALLTECNLHSEAKALRQAQNTSRTTVESTKFGTYVIRKPSGTLATTSYGTVMEFKTRDEAGATIGLLNL